MTTDPSHASSRVGPQIGFAILSLGMVLLCLKGGFFGQIGAGTLHIPAPGPGHWRIPAGPFMLLFLCTWITGLALFILFPRGISRKRSWILLGLLALLCRLALFSHIPSDDVNRYLWEGRMITESINPYHHAPLSEELAKLAKDDPYHSEINHPDLPAAYPPFALLIFSAVAHLWYHPIAMKLILIAFDMGTLFCILLLLKHRGTDPRWAALYAFNPVILYSFAGQAHFDSMQNFFLLAALVLYDRRRWGWMFLCAGLAIQSKYVGILVLPFLLQRENLKFTPVVVLALFVPYTPFLSADNSQLFYCITHFAQNFAFNGSIHGVLLGFFGSLGTATAVTKVLLGLVLLAGYWYFHPTRKTVFQNDPISGSFFALGALLVLSPTVHFWYLTWIIPFLCLRPMASWMLLTLTVTGYFITPGIQHQTGTWRLPLSVQILEWTPFLLLLTRDAFLGWHRARFSARPPEPRSISVIIPTFNEAETIASCIEAANGDSAVSEILIIDAGSTDETVELARKSGATVIEHTCPPESGGGRGGQVAAGIKAATSDVVAILHADTILEPPGFTRILECLQKEPTVVGGSVGSVFDGKGFHLRLLESANDFRAACLGISFGDQVQFFRRAPVVACNSYPDIPLMEDVELNFRLTRLGRLAFLFGSARVSARQWQSRGLTRTALVLRLVGTYLMKRLFGKPDTLAMYRRYYGERR